MWGKWENRIKLLYPHSEVVELEFEIGQPGPKALKKRVGWRSGILDGAILRRELWAESLSNRNEALLTMNQICGGNCKRSPLPFPQQP